MDVGTVEKDLPRRIASEISKGGIDLGFKVDVVEEGEVRGKVQPRDMPGVALGPSLSQAEVRGHAQARVAEPGSFAAKYGKLGFLLANVRRPERREEMLADLARATPEDMQAIAKVNAATHSSGIKAELDMRFDRYLANFPEKRASIESANNGKSPEQNMADAKRSFGNENFKDQQRLSLGDDGQPVQLDQRTSNNMRSARDGYKAIDARLRELGLMPEVTMNGVANGARRSTDANRAAAVGAAEPLKAPQAKRKLSRGGVELGGR